MRAPITVLYTGLSAPAAETDEGRDAAHDMEDWQPAANEYNSQADRID